MNKPGKCICILMMIVELCGCTGATEPLIFLFGESAEGSGYRVTEQTNWPYEDDGLVHGLTGSYTFRNGFLSTDQTCSFWVSLPEGNYQVRLVIGDPDRPSQTTVKAESRRLMVHEWRLDSGQSEAVNILVNVRTPRINDTTAIRLKERELESVNWDPHLTLEFGGDNPTVRSIEIKEARNVPQLFLAGNSTVVDQENEPWASWGQLFPLFLKPEVVVVNLAESGESMRSFIGEKRFEKIASMIRPGDYLFVEFAHNDQKPGSGRLEPFTTYQEYLMKFVELARKSGATPVLVTSTSRRKFNENGQLINTLEAFPDAMRQLAATENLHLIDLNEMSKVLFEAMGVVGSKRAFVHYPAGTFPGQQEALADNTHFSTYGAWQLAKCVVRAIEASDWELRAYLKEDLPTYDPQKPDPYSHWNWPVSTKVSKVKPDGE